jgi:hypothetical protein
VEGAGADFDVIGLEQYAALFVPEVLQAQDDFLERGFLVHRETP